MLKNDDAVSEFENFQVMRGDTDVAETEALMKNMAQLFSHVAHRCDDKQISHYDNVLCQLSDMVSDTSLIQVSHMLAPLDRAPGNIVMQLARRDIDIACPLLEQSVVLTDDNLVDIAVHQTEDHRVSIARREHIVAPVTHAIVSYSEGPSAIEVAQNEGAEFKTETLKTLVVKAKQDASLADALRGRTNIVPVDQANRDVHKPRRGPTKTTFNDVQWRIAWGQIQSMNDRGEVNMQALQHVAAQGAGHQVAALFAKLTYVQPEIVIQWLKEVDTTAFSVAAKAKDFKVRDFALMMSQLPFSRPLSQEQWEKIGINYNELDAEEARHLFAVWHAKAMKDAAAQKRVA